MLVIPSSTQHIGQVLTRDWSCALLSRYLELLREISLLSYTAFRSRPWSLPSWMSLRRFSILETGVLDMKPSLWGRKLTRLRSEMKLKSAGLAKNEGAMKGRCGWVENVKDYWSIWSVKRMSGVLSLIARSEPPIYILRPYGVSWRESEKVQF